MLEPLNGEHEVRTRRQFLRSTMKNELEVWLWEQAKSCDVDVARLETWSVPLDFAIQLGDFNLYTIREILNVGLPQMNQCIEKLAKSSHAKHSRGQRSGEVFSSRVAGMALTTLIFVMGISRPEEVSFAASCRA
jgi:hypothetical protein